jgi:hypothetical protein
LASDYADYERQLELERLRREVFSRLAEPGVEELLPRLVELEKDASGLEPHGPEGKATPSKRALLINTGADQSADDHTLGAELTGLTTKALLRMSHVPTGIVHLLSPESEPLVSFEVQLESPREFARLRITSYVEGYSARAVDTIELFGDQRKATFRQLPTFFPERVRTLTEQTQATLHIEIDDLGGDTPSGLPRTELHRSLPIWLLPPTTAWLEVRDPTTGKPLDTARYFGAWVTPNAPKVLAVLRKAADHAKALGGGIVGYQAGEEGTLKQARAIFEALKDESLTYVNTTFATGGSGTHTLQRVRLPRESLDSRSANCIDGAVLFASLLEASSLLAGIVIIPRHAFVAWKPTRYPALDDWEYLETTMISTSDFEAARSRGRLLATQYAGQKKLLPLYELRRQGIVPME